MKNSRRHYNGKNYKPHRKEAVYSLPATVTGASTAKLETKSINIPIASSSERRDSNSGSLLTRIGVAHYLFDTFVDQASFSSSVR
jgi:beta-phosphoglucomutase-like phosphatase (HAD superfamily)